MKFAYYLANRPSVFACVGIAALNYRGMGDVWNEGHWFVVALWLLILLTSLAPTWQVLVYFRRRQCIRGSRCTVCGYDLTGNTSGVCPECGTPTSAGVKA